MDKEKINTEYSSQEKEIVREFRMAKKYALKGNQAELTIIIPPDGKCYIKITHREKL